jgi:hypothetical protein
MLVGGDDMTKLREIRETKSISAKSIAALLVMCHLLQYMM